MIGITTQRRVSRVETQAPLGGLLNRPPFSLQKGLFSCFSYSGKFQTFLNAVELGYVYIWSVLEKGSHIEPFLWDLVGLTLRCLGEETGFPYLIFGLCIFT